MYHGLEVRVPLLDLELADLSANVDPSAAIHGDVGKVVLREALARHVPPGQIPVVKKGFTIPLGDWLRTDLRPVVEDRLLSGDAFPAGAFDPALLRPWYQAHLDGTRNLTRGLWNLLALQLWAERHLRPLDLP
jgi:asparagine synthase (glutamine-hydrolysing)